jgi:glucose/arabinose dehydrogenase
MKSLLIAMGLAVALSVGAQTTTDEQQQQSEKAKTTKTEENVQPGQTKQNVQPAETKKSVQPTERERTHTDVNRDVNQSEGARVKTDERIRGDERHSGARVDERGEVSHATTVFRNGRETHESLALHRGFRDRTDVHFGIGTHPRDWWLRTYSIVLIDGCHYYLADNGCWYPAYGFDPSCSFPEGAVYCE